MKPGPKEHAGDLNRILGFLARRDIPELSKEAFQNHCGEARADLLIFVAGLSAPDLAVPVAEAWWSGIAKKIMVVGGKGHSTENLRSGFRHHLIYHAVPTDDRAEADMVADLMIHHLNVPADKILIENHSTNCGKNAALALEVARTDGPFPHSVILIQEAAMQRRTYECFLHEWKETGAQFTNFALSIPHFRSEGETLTCDHPQKLDPAPFEYQLQLVLGEIPRLRDDEHGYGPNGSGFIGHVDIPAHIESAFARLQCTHASKIRKKLS